MHGTHVNSGPRGASERSARLVQVRTRPHVPGLRRRPSCLQIPTPTPSPRAPLLRSQRFLILLCPAASKEPVIHLGSSLKLVSEPVANVIAGLSPPQNIYDREENPFSCPTSNSCLVGGYHGNSKCCPLGVYAAILCHSGCLTLFSKSAKWLGSSFHLGFPLSPSVLKGWVFFSPPCEGEWKETDHGGLGKRRRIIWQKQQMLINSNGNIAFVWTYS